MRTGMTTLLNCKQKDICHLYACLDIYSYVTLLQTLIIVDSITSIVYTFKLSVHNVFEVGFI